MNQPSKEILQALQEGKIIQMLQDDGWEECTITDVMYHLWRNTLIDNPIQLRVKKEFKREERYSVFKYKDLDELSPALRSTAYGYLDVLTNLVDTVECVVVESDWNCYEDVWKLVEEEANEIS